MVDLLDQQIKNVMFEYSYLNEKIYKRNNKMKSILHPALQRKQIVESVLKSLWESHLKIAKQSGDKMSQKLEADTKKLDNLNDVERAKL